MYVDIYTCIHIHIYTYIYIYIYTYIYSSKSVCASHATIQGLCLGFKVYSQVNVRVPRATVCEFLADIIIV